MKLFDCLNCDSWISQISDLKCLIVEMLNILYIYRFLWLQKSCFCDVLFFICTFMEFFSINLHLQSCWQLVIIIWFEHTEPALCETGLSGSIQGSMLSERFLQHFHVWLSEMFSTRRWQTSWRACVPEPDLQHHLIYTSWETGRKKD